MVQLRSQFPEERDERAIGRSPGFWGAFKRRRRCAFPKQSPVALCIVTPSYSGGGRAGFPSSLGPASLFHPRKGGTYSAELSKNTATYRGWMHSAIGCRTWITLVSWGPDEVYLRVMIGILWTIVWVTAFGAEPGFEELKQSGDCTYFQQENGSVPVMRAECDWPEITTAQMDSMLGRYEDYDDYIFQLQPRIFALLRTRQRCYFSGTKSSLSRRERAWSGLNGCP